MPTPFPIGLNGGKINSAPIAYGGGVPNGAIPNGANIFGTRVPAIPNVTGPTLNQSYPNLSGTNSQLSSALSSELTGQLSPATLAAIQDAAASYGVSSGMPGSGLAINRGPRDIGLATEDLIHRGIGDYASTIPAVSATQTVNPSQAAQLNTEINATNAVNASAPDPTAANSYAMQLFNRYLQSQSGPAGGSGQPWYMQGVGGQYSQFNANPYSRTGSLPGDFIAPPNLVRGMGPTR